MKIPNTYEFENVPIEKSLDANLENIKRILGNTADLLISPITVSGVRAAVICFEGMVSGFNTAQVVVKPLMRVDIPDCTSEKLYSHVKENMILSVDTTETDKYGDVIRTVMSGFVILLIDNIPSAMCFGIQGYSVRGIDEPSSEGNIMGSHEGFVETVRTNMSLVRRRIKSPVLQFKLFPISPRSKTDVVVCYMADRVPKALVDSICHKLKDVDLETILGSGYVTPFLDSGAPSVFSGLSTTERPDVMCAKILEGRVGGIYVAAALFHPEMFNSRLLMNLAAAEEAAPLNLMWEALITLIFYEIIREAGVRLPKSVGGAVSIVGGLIIGDAAVSAGIISNPMLLVCAISVTASFVIPSLDQQVTVFRLAAVVLGGFAGLYGIALLTAFLLANICAAENYGLPVMAPVSPFTRKAMGDVAVRLGFRRMGKRGFTVEKLNGADIRSAAEREESGDKHNG